AFPRKRPPQGWLIRIFRENVGIKVLSLILAIVFFALVRTEQGNEAEIEIPVQLSALSEDLVFVGEMPRKIKVLVRYKWSRPKKDTQPPPYIVDLRGFENEKVFVFDAEKIRLAMNTEGMSIVSIYPPEFTVEVEPKVEKTVKVKLNLVGISEKGYDVVVEEARSLPPVIKVRGAKSAVKDIDIFATHPIDISKFKKDVILDNVPLQKPSSKFLFMETDTVRVEIPVREIPGQKMLDNVEVKVRNCPEGFMCIVTPPLVNMTLTGPLPSIFLVENGQEKAEVWVDAALIDAKVDKHQGIKLSCDRPMGLKCVETPKSVTLTIQKNPAEPSR
ncbi:MAG TPA: YbbR-like domain-containing protein, partial [Myxococcota bacterium]|nr:YbbR-like domain-containing protein [Myxococcota bacterium]